MYYLVARPETVKSLVFVGRLPANLPAWIPSKEIMLFDNPQQSILTTSTNLRQTFVLEMQIPPATITSLITELHNSQNTTSAVVIAKQLNPQWVQKIFVYSKASENLISKLFNDECPIDIQIMPELFTQEPIKVKEEKFNSNIVQKPIVLLPITYLRQGDILGSKAQTLVNTVNCVGVMGKGIALEFKRRFPNMFTDYKQRCQRGEVKLGIPYLYKTANERWIINFPTKHHWKNKSELQYIEVGLQYIVSNIFSWGVTSLAIPPLGCGNGGLNWEDVQPLIEKYLSPLNIPIEIYCPFYNPKIGVNANTHQHQFSAGLKLTRKRNPISAEISNGCDFFPKPSRPQLQYTETATPAPAAKCQKCQHKRYQAY